MLYGVKKNVDLMYLLGAGGLFVFPFFRFCNSCTSNISEILCP